MSTTAPENNPALIRRVRAFLSGVLGTWPDALALSPREKTAVQTHLAKACVYNDNSSAVLATNSIGAAAIIIFGVRVDGDTRQKFATAVRDELYADG